MKKKVTKEEVERVLEQYLTPITKEPILNELFPIELEDNRVDLEFFNHYEFGKDYKSFVAINGHYFKTNEDGTEVTLHKK